MRGGGYAAARVQCCIEDPRTSSACGEVCQAVNRLSRAVAARGPRSSPVAGVTHAELSAPRPRGLDARGGTRSQWTALGHKAAGREGQGRAAHRVSAADAHAPWACEDEGDVSVNEG